MNTFGLNDALLIIGGSIALGVVSAFGPAIYAALRAAFGRITVKRSAAFMSRVPPDETDRRQTDDRQTSAAVTHPAITRLQLDRTKSAVMELLLYSGWTLTDARRENIFRGDNNVISDEWDAARARLGMAPAQPYRTPIVGRSTSARFETDPDYPYAPPA